LSFLIEEVKRLENPRPEKVAVVEEVRARLDAADAAILTEYRGLSVKDMAVLRRSLTEAGGTYKVYKNTLVRFAARDLGLDELEAMLQGPTAIAFVAGDAVDVAKALRDFARTHPALVVKGGVLGTKVLSSADAAALADVAPREVLLARFAGALAAPMVQFAGLLQALPRNLAYGLKALIELKGGVPEPDAEPAGPAPTEASAPVEPEAEPAAEETPAAAPAEPAAEETPAAAEAPAEPATPSDAEPAQTAAEAPAEPSGPSDAEPAAEPASPSDAEPAAEPAGPTDAEPAQPAADAPAEPSAPTDADPGAEPPTTD
jgi:large subunit ribosomal protein L10